MLSFFVRREIAGSLEPGAWSASHCAEDVRHQMVRRQTLAWLFLSGARQLGAWSRELGARLIVLKTADIRWSDVSRKKLAVSSAGVASGDKIKKGCEKTQKRFSQPFHFKFICLLQSDRTARHLSCRRRRASRNPR